MKRHIYKAYNYYKKNGAFATYIKIKEKISPRYIEKTNKYLWTSPTDEVLREQRNHKFSYNPYISLIVPVFNPPENFLHKMIESVQNQTYSNWELCLADGSTDKKVYMILQEYHERNQKIKIKIIGENKGISGNSNEALSMATGEYVALLDNDDLLTPDALFEVVEAINENDKPDLIYTDEDKTDERGERFFDPHFKADFAPDMLRSYNYICHLSVIKKALLEKIGSFNSEFDGSQDYDLILRATEQADKIIHIPKVLYHWRVHSKSTAAGDKNKPYTHIAGEKALTAHLQRMQLKGKVLNGADGNFPNVYRVIYDLIGQPIVSILIPNCNHMVDLQNCLESIWEKTTYPNYEIIIIENNTTDEATFNYYKEIDGKRNVKVIYWKDEFNYSAINNWAVLQAKGEYIVFMNNDIELITSDWIEEMLMFVQRNDVGAVGAKLYYQDNTVQHAGVIIGIGGVGGHSHKYSPRKSTGYYMRLLIAQNLSAVTAALLMMPRRVFDEIGGFNEDFKVAFNDIDLCMKIRKAGYLIVFSPYVEAYHYESKSRGPEDTVQKMTRFNSEIELFQKNWGKTYDDPYYNVNLTLDREDFSLK